MLPAYMLSVFPTPTYTLHWRVLVYFSNRRKQVRRILTQSWEHKWKYLQYMIKKKIYTPISLKHKKREPRCCSLLLMPCLHVLQLMLWLCPCVFRWLVMYAALPGASPDVTGHLAFVAHHVRPQPVFVAKAAVHVCMRRKTFLNIDYPVLHSF